MRPSEVAAGVGVVCLLLALLTWLLVRGIATDVADYSTTLRIFDDFALAEASLDRDVLQARAGMLTDFDPLVRSSEQIAAAVSQLRAQAVSEGLDTGPVDRLAAATKIEEKLTERFKSDNALLRNSLSYVGHLSTSPGFTDRRLGALATAILQLTLDFSARSQQAVEERLLELAVQPPVEADQGTSQALISHVRLLKILLPSVDDTIKGLFAVHTGPPLEETRAQFARLHVASESSAQRFRLLLYATSVLLALALIDLGRRLRARAVALRKRAAFEHLIAEQSARLINCPPAETKVRLEQALAEFGRMVEADRVYVVLSESPIRVYSWSEDHAPYLLGWPERALSLPGEFKEVRLGIIATPDTTRLPPGGARKTLLSFGIHAWACVVLQQAGYDRCILGFDRLQPARGAYFFPLEAVRLAGDAIAGALEREKRERENVKLTGRLERALRMQMVGQLASGVAHNFNNIIAAILGYSEMAGSEVETGGKAARRIAEIEKAAERGRELVDSILTFGRRSDVRSSLISVTELLSETASLLRASLPSSVELVVADAAAGLAVFGEPAQLQQIIVNLCRNAAQATGGSGRIDVSADAQHLMIARVFSVGELEPGSYARIAVSDDGPGFSEEVGKWLFEPFFTTRPAGTGLGLATVRKIVRDHDGAVDVASAPGKGSRFEVWLPAANTDASTTMRSEPVVPPRLGQGETVLIVHDDRNSLLGDEEILAALGYEPIGFDRPADAIAAVRSEPTRFDAVLICAASVGNALDLAHALHGISPTQPIFLARSALDIGADTLVRAGVADLVRRPLVGSELASVLSRRLASTKTLGVAHNIAR
jgi:signal transduction histidine kinase